ncbi:hypothetical protein C162_03774 [Paenibacillus sp. FSL R7-269]|uniref:hypothetical protein n=1 Tax=Paenibacillus sp. FSL R7-269 TaxID=1226755 RepID=UPI0003E21E59|nr:hypothetical protein [Paenibacillus sp. FSL R7-269]ETT54787.1 hypothetical protein C162_03774 [Paenibacillus sp. FSL R7-269]
MNLSDFQIPVIILAAISGFISYQYNHRAKKRESYLKDLSLSYNEVYTPMFKKLKRIKHEQNHQAKMGLIKDFFDEYSTDSTKVRYIGTSFNLETYFELEIQYEKYLQNPGRTTEHSLIDNMEGFYKSIEAEFWEAHDIIYEDHLQYKSLTRKNIFNKLIIEFLILLHNISSFLLGASLIFVYVCLWNRYIQELPMPEGYSQYLDIIMALLIFLTAVMLFSLTKIFYLTVKKVNRRTNQFLKDLINKIKKKLHL